MEEIDNYIPEPQRENDKPFIMPVEDVFSITGRGTVATGRVERGSLTVGSEVEIVGLTDEKRKVVVTGIEMFRKLLDLAAVSYTHLNFFTVRDILKEYDGEVMRFFLLSGHYRNPINFSDTLMEQAKAGLGRMENAKENLKHLIANGSGEMTDAEKDALEGYDRYRQEFIDAMDDDLNTADAISAIFELITAINTAVKDGASREFAEKSLEVLMELATVVGLLQKEEDNAVDDDIQALVDERQEARKAKNFARADEIRDMLKERGITLKDTPQGVQIIRE